MKLRRVLRTWTYAVLLVSLCASAPADAEDVSKEVCIDSHSRGQDAREANKLTLARKLFLTCAQASCPSLVQGDCARLADELARIQPSLNFAARDARGMDLPGTSVFVDDVLVTTRLDDGKAHDVDPGKHVIKFVRAGEQKVVPIIVSTGERGRTISVTFGAPDAEFLPAQPLTNAPRRPRGPARPLGSKLLVGGGAGLVAGGIALGVLGLSRVPDNCSSDTRECIAPPGDPSLREAERAMQLANVGWLVGGVGVAALAGGLVWYVTSGKRSEHERATRPETTSRVITPWLSPTGGGLSFSGRL